MVIKKNSSLDCLRSTDACHFNCTHMYMFTNMYTYAHACVHTVESCGKHHRSLYLRNWKLLLRWFTFMLDLRLGLWIKRSERCFMLKISLPVPKYVDQYDWALSISRTNVVLSWDLWIKRTCCFLSQRWRQDLIRFYQRK